MHMKVRHSSTRLLALRLYAYLIYSDADVLVHYYKFRVMKAAGKAKAPLAHSEALGWLQSCVKDFGAGVLPAQQVVAFAVSELEHVNPKVQKLHLRDFILQYLLYYLHL